MRKLLLAGALLLIGLGLAELGFAFYYLQRGPAALWQLHPGQGLSHAPRTRGQVTAPEYRAQVSINAAGFADYDHDLIPPPGRYRIAILGDSFIEAVQVDRSLNLCSRLAASLPATPGRSYEVFNFGVAGAGTAQAYELFGAQVRPYRPNLVLLAFYPNDVLNNSYELEPKKYKPFYTLNSGRLERLAPGDPRVQGRNPVLAWWRGHSFIYRFWRDHRPEAVPLELQVYAPGDTPAWARAWEVTAALIRALARQVQAAGGDFMVLYLPSRYELYPDWRAAALQRYPRAAALPWDWGKPGVRLQAICAAAHLHYLNLAPRLAAYPLEPRLYFQRDGHLTAAGHQAVAASLQAALAVWPGLGNARERN